MGLIHGFRGLVYVQGVSLDTHSASIQRQFQLNATITPSNATNRNLVWTSSNTNIATVVDGLVTPTGEGTVTITVTLDGYSDSCTLEVSPIPVTGVSLNKNNVTVNMGSSEQLIASITPSDASNQNVTWSSSNTSVATVSNTGLVTYVADGSCTITVTTEDGGYTATCSVTCVSKRKVRFLLVGGGGGGSQYYGGGGGGGGVIQCTNYEMNAGSYPVVIGAGGCGIGTGCDGNNGGNSTFNGLIAYGGGGGGGYPSRVGHNGGSGGGPGYYNGSPGCGCSGQGYGGGANSGYGSGGGGGAGSVGGNAVHNCLGGYGGCGIQSDISGVNTWYASGGDGHNGHNNCSYQYSCARCPALSGGRAESNATTYGGGGGGAPYNASYGQGKAGIFILAYPSSCGYNITGGTKYLCNGNCIHCFTGNGTLTIS